MIKMKSMLALTTVAAMAAAHDTGHSFARRNSFPESPEEREERFKKAQAESNKAKGLTEFFYGNNSLWALNQKSADKKARKLNWI